MLELKKRDGIWQVEGTINGVRIRKSTGERDKAAAQSVRLEIENEAIAHKNTLTVGDVVDAYLRRSKSVSDATARKVTRFRDEFGHRDPSTLTGIEITNWVGSEGRMTSTARTLMTCSLAALRYGERLGMVTMPKGMKHWPLPAEVAPRDRYLESVEEIEQVIAAAEPWFRPLVALMFMAGLRIGEALELRWDQIKGNSIHVGSMKGVGLVRMRAVPMSQRLAAILGPRGSGHVLRKRNGAALHAYSTAFVEWNKTVERAGFTDLTPHDARRTFATMLIRSGVEALVVARLIGHLDRHGRPHTKMLTRYAYLAPAQDEQAISVFDKTPKMP